LFSPQAASMDCTISFTLRKTQAQHSVQLSRLILTALDVEVHGDLLAGNIAGIAHSLANICAGILDLKHK